MSRYWFVGLWIPKLKHRLQRAAKPVSESLHLMKINRNFTKFPIYNYFCIIKTVSSMFPSFIFSFDLEVY